MKKLIILFALSALITSSGFATVRTVSNNPAGGAQYTNLQDAYNNSLNGDTLMLEGTDDPYFLLSCEWGKLLTVIGIGFNPNKQIPKRTKIRHSNCYSYFPLNPGGSGSRFYGIEFTHLISGGANIDNYLFESCKFNNNVVIQGPSINLLFRNCIFDRDNDLNLELGSVAGASVTSTVSNCVFDGYIRGSNNVLVNLTVDHCVFLGTGAYVFGWVYHFHQLHYAIIKNCVFMNAFPNGTSNSIFTNNLCRVVGTFPPSSGNIENTDPLFVSVPFSTMYNVSQDYNFQAGSPAIGTAIDGTDLGVVGGFTGFTKAGEVQINPIVRAVTIMNTSVAPNGTLNVLIHATKPDND